MATKVSGLIQKIDPGNSTQYSIASTAYGYCQTAAATVAKVCDMTGFTLLEGTTIHVKFQYANTATAPTLNVNGTGAKPIVQYGTTAVGKTASTDGWQAGAVVALTYDGTSWVRDQGYNTNTTYTTMTAGMAQAGTDTTGRLITAAVLRNAYVAYANSAGFASSATWASSAGYATKAAKAAITTTTNAVAKYSDTAGTFANSGVLIDSSNNVTMPAALKVANASTFAAALNVGGATTLANTLAVTGATTHAGAIDVVGKTTVAGGLFGNTNLYGATLPTTATTGQVFFQISDPIYEIPVGGAVGQAIIKNSTTDRDIVWGDVGGKQVPGSTKFYPSGSTSTTANSDDAVFNTNVYVQSDVLYGACWNDYAEFRQLKEDIEIPYGYCVCENGDDTISLSHERMQPAPAIVSDTFGYAIGETQNAKVPIAVSGRVLVYPYEDRNNYKPGDCVCAGPEGKVCIMTREEIKEYPDRIVGIVSAIPQYEIWGQNDIQVDGRIWVKVR